jgi:large conductance mechanosensitive channel protein
VNFNELQWVIKPAVEAKDGIAAQAAVAIKYGTFLDTVIQFLIIAFSVFIAIKFINKLSSLRDLEDLKKLSALANKATDRVAGVTGLADEKKG